jgi:hypothetical protein
MASILQLSLGRQTLKDVVDALDTCAGDSTSPKSFSEILLVHMSYCCSH